MCCLYIFPKLLIVDAETTLSSVYIQCSLLKLIQMLCQAHINFEFITAKLCIIESQFN